MQGTNFPRAAAGVRGGHWPLRSARILWIRGLKAGKDALGRKRIEFDAPTPFHMEKNATTTADFVWALEESLWSEYLPAEKKRIALLLQCDEVRIDGPAIWENVTTRFSLRSRECGWRHGG